MAQYFYSGSRHTHVHAKSFSQGLYRAAAPQLPLYLPEAHKQAHRQAVSLSLSAPILARSVPEQNMGELMGKEWSAPPPVSAHA